MTLTAAVYPKDPWYLKLLVVTAPSNPLISDQCVQKVVTLVVLDATHLSFISHMSKVPLLSLKTNLILLQYTII